MPTHRSASHAHPRARDLVGGLTRLLLGATMLSLPGCAGSLRAPMITLATIGEPAMMCYVHGTGDAALVDTRIVQVRQLWAVTGNVHSAAAAAARRRRVKVEAVTADESLVLATLSPIRTGDDTWTFHLPIPAPAVFDHLHLAIVSADEAFRTLPPHERRYQ